MGRQRLDLALRRRHPLDPEHGLVNAFRSMGCEVALSPSASVAAVHALFDARDLRFSRFIPSSELNRINATPEGVALLSEEFASTLALALDAARATGGLVTPAVGGALIAAGYDRDFALLTPGSGEVAPARVPALGAISLRGRALLRSEPVVLDLNGVVKRKTIDDALALVGRGWVSAGGDIATTGPVEVGLPGGDAIVLERGGLATSSVSKRAWCRAGVPQHHLIDPAAGCPVRTPWRDVTVAAQACVIADVAAKAALLLGPAGPSWLDRRGLPGRFVGLDGTVLVNQAWLNLVPEAQAA
jgi:FAD:protein FMN transferase